MSAISLYSGIENVSNGTFATSTHGELSISKIDRTGKKLWSFDAEDIFVCLDESKPFEMFEDHIALTDFNGKKYRIDYNGQLHAGVRKALRPGGMS
jgi:hypothetical protein